MQYIKIKLLRNNYLINLNCAYSYRYLLCEAASRFRSSPAVIGRVRARTQTAARLGRLRARAYFIRMRNCEARESGRRAAGCCGHSTYRGLLLRTSLLSVSYIFLRRRRLRTERQRGERIKPTSFTSLESGQRSQNGESCLLFLRNGFLGRGKYEGDAGNTYREVICKGWIRRWSEVEGARYSI